MTSNTGEVAPRAATSPGERVAPGPFAGGYRAIMRVAIVAVLIDVALYCLLHRRSATMAGVVQGGLVVFGFSVAVGAMVGLVLGAVLSLSGRAPGRQTGTRDRVRAWFTEGTDQDHARKSGMLVAALFLLAGAAAVSVLIVERLIVEMARANFAAMAATAAVFGALLFALALLPAAGSLAAQALLLLCRLRPLRLVLGRTTRVAALVCFLFFAALGVFGFVFREPLSYLPWEAAMRVLGALILATLWAFAARRWFRSLLFRNASRTLVAVAVLASVAAAVRMTPESVEARLFAEHESLIGGLGYSLCRSVLDFDRDGDIHVLGGGDCAPWDPKINTGAAELPNNGIDENCDGHDTTLEELPRRGQAAFPVPSDFPARPPIVLLTIDAFAARHLEVSGEKRNITPNLDAFAKRSVVFKYCFSQGPSTRLSFPSIFTSRWDTQIQREIVARHPFPLHGSEQLLAEILRDHGYETVAVLGDRYFSESNWKGITRGFERISRAAIREKARHRSGKVTDTALEEIARGDEAPLFLWVHYFDAHGPHSQPQGIKALGTSEEDRYLGELALVDREAGRLLEGIEKEFDGRALVIVSADHGIAFDAPRHAKRHYGHDLHTVTTHVPLIVHAPTVTPKDFDHIVSTMDIAPTITNLLRIKRRLPFEGTSLVPEIFEGHKARPQEILHQYYVPDRIKRNADPLDTLSLRDDRFHFILEREEHRVALYDWRKDYWETEDLSGSPDHQAVLARMRDRLSLYMHDLSRSAAKVIVRKAKKKKEPARRAAKR